MTALVLILVVIATEADLWNTNPSLSEGALVILFVVIAALGDLAKAKKLFS